MAFSLTPNVVVHRDDEGRVRHLEHIREPYSVPDVQSPEELADRYLDDVAELYGIDPAALEELEEGIPGRPSGERIRLHRRDVKSTDGSIAVSYGQSCRGLRVWRADFNVHVASDPVRVTSSSSTFHPDVSVAMPDDDLLARKADREFLEALERAFSRSGLHPERIHASELVIYCHDPYERFDADAREVVDGEGPGAGVPAPALAPVPEVIEAGAHYVTREILFAMEVPGWGELNWRALLEVETGAVLRIRALVARATGSVFASDPVSLSGANHTSASPATDLDPLRSSVTVRGLVSSDPQGLDGAFVTITDLVPAHVSPPTEPAPPDFAYSAVTDDFAAVSAYHHMDAAYRLVQDFGFDPAIYFDGTTFPVQIDHRGMSPPLGDTTGAIIDRTPSGTGTRGFRFGLVSQGDPVGIAATPRVVLHEFGHALLVDHLHAPNFGFAHGPGDSLAAILHDPESRALDRYVTFPFMAASNPASGNRRHDRSVSAGWGWNGPNHDPQYLGTQILSTTLFRLYESIGGNASDLATRRFASRYVAYLIVKAIGTMTSTTTDPAVFATALMNADVTTSEFEGVAGGRIHKVVRWAFEKQGLYQGDPPDVDVHVDDGRGGEYWASQFAGLQSRWIWNRHAPDGGADHQRPRTGEQNFVYTLVRNRGLKQATDVSVIAFHSEPGAPGEWPGGWTPMPPGPRSVPALGPGATDMAGPFEWTPASSEDTSLLAVVSAAGDASNDATVAGSVAIGELVPFDNNLAVRAVQPLPSFESWWRRLLAWLSEFLSGLFGG